MRRFSEVFPTTKPVIAMVHVRALPGTPRSILTVKKIAEIACHEAETYARAGVDAVMIENMHDIPYLNSGVGPEITAAMAVVGAQMKQACGLPCGIQILAAANCEAMAAAHAAGMDFIRAEGFVFGHVADEGYIDSCAGALLRYRKQIGADNILVFTDIKKKHSSHAVTADVSIAETAHAAEFFLSDGVIVTGVSTGTSADTEEIKAVSQAVSLPVLVGSGITYENCGEYLSCSDGMIIGSYFKKSGKWQDDVDFAKVRDFMDKVKDLRK